MPTNSSQQLFCQTKSHSATPTVTNTENLLKSFATGTFTSLHSMAEVSWLPLATFLCSGRNNSCSGDKTQGDFVGPFYTKIHPVRQQTGEQRLLKSHRPPVPTNRVLNGFLQNLILEVPLQRTEGFNFHSDRTGLLGSPRSAKARMCFRAQLHRKPPNAENSSQHNQN